jgi:hypothetical protein
MNTDFLFYLFILPFYSFTVLSLQKKNKTHTTQINATRTQINATRTQPQSLTTQPFIGITMFMKYYTIVQSF